MTDDTRDNGGQFATPAYGAASVERQQGFDPMPDPEKKKPAEASSVKEAAESLSERRAKPDTVKRQYLADDGESPADSNLSVTPARAARDLQRIRQAEEAGAQDEINKHVADAFDEATGAKKEASDLDPEIAKALKHPQVAEAIQEKISEADKVRQQHSEALETSMALVRETLLADIPNIAELTNADLELMRLTEPQKYQRLEAMASAASKLAEQKAQQQAEFKKSFDEYARGEDAKFDAIASKEKPETLKKVQAKILEMAKSHGVTEKQFIEAVQTQPILRSVAIQAMMMDAAKYHLHQKDLAEAKEKALRVQAPPMQRPGTSGPRVDPAQANIAKLQKDLETAGGSGQIAAAAKLLTARRAAR